MKNTLLFLTCMLSFLFISCNEHSKYPLLSYGKFGCIPKKWFILTDGKFVETHQIGQLYYIQFEHATGHLFDALGNPKGTQKLNNVYLRSEESVVKILNDSIFKKDIDSVKIAVQSPFMQESTNGNRIYFESVYVFYKGKVIFNYPTFKMQDSAISHSQIEHPISEHDINNKLGKFGCIPSSSISFSSDHKFLMTPASKTELQVTFKNVIHHINGNANNTEIIPNVFTILSIDEALDWNSAIQYIPTDSIGIGMCTDLSGLTGHSFVKAAIYNTNTNKQIYPDPKNSPCN